MKRNFASTFFAITFFCLATGASAQAQGSQGAGAPQDDAAAQKRTIADLRNIGTAMFSWLTDQVGAAAAGQSQTPQAPDSADLAKYPPISREDLIKILVPTYLQTVPELDGWGHPYELYLNTADPTGQTVMALRSPGRDGKFSGGTYKVGAFPAESYDDDLVWVDGYFVRWPEKPGV